MVKKGKIALLTGQADETYQKEFVTGAMRSAFKAGYDLCVFSMFIKYQSSREREIGDSNIYNLINYEMFDAVIVMSDTIQTPGVAKKIEDRIHKEYKGPVIMVDVESEYFKSFWTDGYQEIYDTVSHLIEKHGCKDIEFLSGRSFHRHSIRRAEAFKDAMKDHGLAVSDDMISWSDFWYTGGAAFAEHLLHDRENLPDAVACANDHMAIGLADALEKAGINVPEDLAITGYGTIEEGRNSPKALTSSYVQGEYYGQYAVECVLEMMDGRDIKEPEYESTLFIGESCGCDGKSDVSLKREHWFTNESEAGFYSLHNTMEGDLQNCDSIDSFLAEVCEHMYNLKNIDRIDICLNDSWLNRDVPEISGFPTDGYTDRIIWAISYESDKPRDGKYGLDRSFDKKELLPAMDSENPAGYIFTPLNFGQYSFGYTAINFGERADSYTEAFRLWSQALSRGFEDLRRALQIKELERRLALPANEKVAKDVDEEDLVLVKEILDNNLFTYHFQPIVNASDGSIYAYEALMRSKTDRRISPLSILDCAENLGRMQDIERATFINVLAILDEKKEEFKGRKVFINSIPGCRLEEEDKIKVVDSITMANGGVVIELTESAELDDSDLERLKKGFEEMGAGFAIDDYGTGYSNVSNLLRYMPNVVKIDRSLLTNIQESPQKEHFVRDIIEFCHDNDIKALAEGVETAGELRCLIRMGADLIQGYYTAKPSPEILDVIDSTVREEIIRINKEIENGEDNRFMAGNTTRVSVSQLMRERFSTIVVGSEDVKFKNITIVGAPGREQLMDLVILDGYKGQITLENVTLSTPGNHPCIKIGNDCNVGLKFMGGNKLKGGGILVPETSKLDVEGKGSIIIQAGGDQCFGIGNVLNKKHGDIVFFIDGDITMELSGADSVGVGSGLGGNIAFNKGRYIFNMNSDSAVCVGSVTGPTNISLNMCNQESRILSKKAVTIGSLYGDTYINMKNCSVLTRITGQQAVAIGSLEGMILKYEAREIAVRADIKAGVGSCIAALCGNTDVQIDDTTIDYNGVGNELYVIGGMMDDTHGELCDCDMNVDLKSENGCFSRASKDSLYIQNGRFTGVDGDWA